MKTTKPKTKPVKIETTRMQSYYPSILLDESIKRFRESSITDMDGKSKHLTEKVIQTIEIILKTRPNFTIQDVIRQGKAFNISADYIIPVFEQMTDYLCSVGKLSRTESVYSEGQMFIVHV